MRLVIDHNYYAHLQSVSKGSFTYDTPCPALSGEFYFQYEKLEILANV